jgi:glycosyltransferase involved in cell wall biosynthesis
MTLEQCWHRVPGGTAVAALGMARALRDRPEVELIGVAARHRAQPPQEWRPPIEVAKLSLPRVALYESWHRFRQPSVERATGPVHAIHATSLAVPPRSAPLIVTIHDLAFLRDPSHFTKHGLSFFNRGTELARADGDLILCPSEATARDCRDNGFEAARVRVVPLGVEQDEMEKSQAIEEVRSLGIEQPYVLWTGTVEPRKNLPRLLRAWRKVDTDARLVLVGPPGWNEKLGPLIEATPRVTSLGWVPHRHLTALYSAAVALCWPSLWEGFGFPVLEAMVQSTAVITSRETSTEEIAGSAALLVDPHDEVEIAAGLQQVLDDPETRARLAAAGRERARTFTWDATANALVDAYATTVGALT